jgi:hypothetical protein
VKLAGNELANFSAFLRPEWRANDWLWGRLDAVPTLVDILVDPERLRSRHTKDSAFAAIEHLAVPDGHPLHELLAEEWKGSKDLELGYSRAEKVKAELDTLMGGGDAANTPLVEIRNALIARRQWEILAEELALPTNLEPARSKPSPETVPAERFDVANTKWMTPVPLKDQVKQYAVGAETIRTVDDALPDRFDALIEATAQAIRWNASTEHGGRLPLGGRITPLVLGVLRAVLRLGSTQLLKPASGRQRARTATAVALAVAALAAAVVYGIVTNPTAFILGIAVTLAIVVALGAVAAVWMRPNE